MSEPTISIDEFLSKRAGATRDGILFKAAKAPASWNPEKRSARFVMSTPDTDRDGDIVHTRGIDLTEFLKNPICLLNHRAADPIGQWENIVQGRNKLEGDAVLAAAGTTPEVDKAAGLIGAGILRASSIGFLPKTVKPIVREDGSITWSFEIMECDLVECSIVSIPSNPMALAKDAGPMGLCRDLIEEVLDTYAKDPATGLIVPRAEYEAAQKELTGNRTSVTVDISTLAADKSLIERLADRVKSIISPPPKPPSAEELKAAKEAAAAALKLVA